MDINYYLLKLYININNKNKLKIELMTKGILEDKWSTIAIKNVLFILANKVFINIIVKIMLKRRSKAKIVLFVNNDIFLFMYDIKTMVLGHFPNSKLFYVNNF